MTKITQKVRLTAEQHLNLRALFHDVSTGIEALWGSCNNLIAKSDPDSTCRGDLTRTKKYFISRIKAFQTSLKPFQNFDVGQPIEVSANTWRRVIGGIEKTFGALSYFTETLDKHQTDFTKPETKRSARNCRRSIESATRCLTAIADGTFKHKPQPHRINPNKFVTDFLTQAIADRHGKPVNVRFNKGDVGSINADPTRLRIALGNLVSDAVNHRPENPVTVETVRQNGTVSIYVITERDKSGRVEPIPKDKLDVIGRRVYSTSQPTSDKPFRGFGKVTTRSFCMDSGGEFTVENRDGRPCIGMHFPKAK